MPDPLDRSELIEAGWKQGVIVAPLAHIEYSGDCFLLLTQTCDCINPDLGKEPFLEFLPLTFISEPDKQLTHGQNPRVIQFQILDSDSPRWVQAEMKNILLWERGEQTSLSISQNLTLPSDKTLASLIQWRVAKYQRHAFPDSFINAFNSIKRPFSKKLKQEQVHPLIDSLYIQLDHYEELTEPGDAYEVNLLILVKPDTIASPEKALLLKELVEGNGNQKGLESIMNNSVVFDASCKVASLDDSTLTISVMRTYLSFTDYDYLSFSDEVHSS